jgi:hypothetical protein
MDTRETLSAKLPPTRQDEPAQLRQDILDELSDHLICACNREILRGVESSAAHRRVLERFGDPAALARRLWLDAMRGKIMTQRVVIGTCVLVTAASLALVGIVWQQARRMVAIEVAEARAREMQVLEQLRAMSEAIKHPRSPDWNPLRLKLTEEAPDGPPVAGATIVLTRLFENPPKTIQKQSDASGLADFGSIQPGDYTFYIYRNCEDRSMQSQGSLNVQPGSDVTKSIICPNGSPQHAQVHLRWQWPSDLEKEPLCLYAAFSLYTRSLGPGNDWNINRLSNPKSPRDAQNQVQGGMNGGPQSTFPIANALLCGPSTNIGLFVQPSVPFLWSLPDGTAKTNDVAKEYGSREWVDFVEKDIREFKDSAATIDMEAGKHSLRSLLVLRACGPQKDLDAGQRRYELLAVTNGSPNPPYVRFPQQPPDLKILEQWSGSEGFTTRPSYRAGVFRAYWEKVTGAFEANLGQPNEWTIPIPDELAKAVRRALKAENEPNVKPAEKDDSSKGNG